MNSKQLLQFAALMMVVTTLGCVSGPPKPTKLISNAKKASKEGNDAEVLANFEKVLDTAPSTLAKKQYEDELKLYRESQIRFGMAEAAKAEQEGRYSDAWVWWLRTANVDLARDECKKALAEADRVRALAAEQSLKTANDALARGDNHTAATSAAQSLWLKGSDGARAAFVQASSSPTDATIPFQSTAVLSSHVNGVLRTDTLQKLVEPSVYAPYGIPIYFGDVPWYYKSMGPIKVNGSPYAHTIPAEYSVMDSLSYMSAIAKAAGADAIINVRIWTSRKNKFTLGECIKFLPANAPVFAETDEAELAAYKKQVEDAEKATTQEVSRHGR